MKKLMVFALVAACAIQAQAVLTVTLSTAADGSSPKMSDQGYYACWAHSLAEYQEFFEVTKAQTDKEILATVQSYFSTAAEAGTYDEAVSDWKTGGGVTDEGLRSIYRAGDSADGALVFGRSAGSAANNSIFVFFYEKDGQQSYRVVVSADKTSSSKTDIALTETAGAANSQWGTWQAVPEPTSGMLLLLGVAGLMLKRKRA